MLLSHEFAEAVNGGSTKTATPGTTDYLIDLLDRSWVTEGTAASAARRAGGLNAYPREARRAAGRGGPGAAYSRFPPCPGKSWDCRPRGTVLAAGSSGRFGGPGGHYRGPRQRRPPVGPAQPPRRHRQDVHSPQIPQQTVSVPRARRRGWWPGQHRRHTHVRRRAPSPPMRARAMPAAP